MAGGPVVCVTPLPSAVVVRCPPSAPESLLVFRVVLAHFLARSVYMLRGMFRWVSAVRSGTGTVGTVRTKVETRGRCWTGFPRIQSDGPSWSVPIVSSRRQSTPIRRRVGRLVGPRPHSVSRRRCRALPSARPTRRLSFAGRALLDPARSSALHHGARADSVNAGSTRHGVASAARSEVEVMARQVGPTRQMPVLHSGHRNRHTVEAGVCGFHQGPGVDASQHEAGHMSPTDPALTISETHPWQVWGRPHMCRGTSTSAQ